MTNKATGLERETLVIKGARSELRLEGGVITILKEATTQATPTSVTIEVRNVRGSTVEVPRRGGRGWLHIATVNGSPAPVGEMSASGDPFALPITARQLSASRKLARLIDRHVKDRGMPADVGPNQGRFSSGVVLSPTKPAADRVEESPAVRTAGAKKAVAKKSVAKKAVAKKAVAGGELVGQLRELGELHATGVLTDAEFVAAKAKLLA